MIYLQLLNYYSILLNYSIQSINLPSKQSKKKNAYGTLQYESVNQIVQINYKTLIITS